MKEKENVSETLVRLCDAIETNNKLIELGLPELIESIDRLGIDIESISNSIDNLGISKINTKN